MRAATLAGERSPPMKADCGGGALWRRTTGGGFGPAVPRSAGGEPGMGGTSPCASALRLPTSADRPREASSAASPTANVTVVGGGGHVRDIRCGWCPELNVRSTASRLVTTRRKRLRHEKRQRRSLRLAAVLEVCGGWRSSRIPERCLLRLQVGRRHRRREVRCCRRRRNHRWCSGGPHGRCSSRCHSQPQPTEGVDHFGGVAFLRPGERKDGDSVRIHGGMVRHVAERGRTPAGGVGGGERQRAKRTFLNQKTAELVRAPSDFGL